MKARYAVYITLNEKEIEEVHSVKGKETFKSIFMLGLNCLKKKNQKELKDENKQNN